MLVFLNGTAIYNQFKKIDGYIPNSKLKKNKKIHKINSSIDRSILKNVENFFGNPKKILLNIYKLYNTPKNNPNKQKIKGI